MLNGVDILQTLVASGAHLDMNHAPYNVYGVKYIDLEPLRPFQASTL